VAVVRYAKQTDKAINSFGLSITY